MNTRSESQEELTGRPKISQEEIFKAYTLVLNKTREFCATRQISEILPASNSRCFEFIQEKMYWFGDTQNPDLILPPPHSFQKQYAAQYFGNVYTIGPSYRREPKARLNSNLFYQIEIEVKDSNLHQTQQLALDYFRFVEGAFFQISIFADPPCFRR